MFEGNLPAGFGYLPTTVAGIVATAYIAGLAFFFHSRHQDARK